MSWGTALAYDQKGRALRKWQSIVRKNSAPKQQSGLTGAALEQAVMAMAASDSSLVKIEAAGAS